MSEAEQCVRRVLSSIAIDHFTRSDAQRMYVCLSGDVTEISLDKLNAIAEELGTSNIKVLLGNRKLKGIIGFYILIEGIKSVP